jgi:hypothetical protein
MEMDGSGGGWVAELAEAPTQFFIWASMGFGWATGPRLVKLRTARPIFEWECARAAQNNVSISFF